MCAERMRASCKIRSLCAERSANKVADEVADTFVASVPATFFESW